MRRVAILFRATLRAYFVFRAFYLGAGNARQLGARMRAFRRHAFRFANALGVFDGAWQTEARRAFPRGRRGGTDFGGYFIRFQPEIFRLRRGYRAQPRLFGCFFARFDV